MMARSTKGSNQRPDTLMQDRTSANSMKVLLQRTAGPYIRVISVRDIRGSQGGVCPVSPKSGRKFDLRRLFAVRRTWASRRASPQREANTTQCELCLQDKLERGPEHSTFKRRDVRCNTQRGFECAAKQSIVRHNDAPKPCRPSYRRKSIIDHRLLVSAYRHRGGTCPAVYFNQLTTKQASIP